MPSETNRSVTLPSRGLLYGGKVPDGKVTIRKLRIDELSMFEAQGDPWDRVETLMTTCVKFPAGFHPSELLASDRFALLIALRNFTLPVKYPVNYSCSGCGAANHIKVDLATSLNVRMAEEADVPADPEKGTPAKVKFAEPIKISLPDCEKVVEFRFLRASDQQQTLQYARRIKQQNPNDITDPSIKHGLARRLVAIDGVAPANLLYAEQFIGALPGLDAVKIRNTLDAADVGVDTEITADCKACGRTNKVDLPFGEEFFRPTDL